MKYSIAQARQAIEHLIARNEDGSTIIDAARQGALILAWLERREELLKAVDRLDRSRPDLVDLFKAFPGTDIVNFHNGSGRE